MADTVRLVTLDAGGRTEVIADLNDFISFMFVRDSFTITAPQKQPILASAERRYGGSRQVGESHENGAVSWSALVKGNTADECIAAISTLTTLLERTDGDLFIEWLPDGASTSKRTLYEVRGTGTWSPRYQWAQFAGAQSLVFEVAWPVAPRARGLPMNVLDGFDVDTRSDYTYDSGVAASETVSRSALFGVGTLSTERRAIHTIRGYLFIDSLQQVAPTPGTTLTGFKAGVVVKRISATTYLELYVDDDGTTSRMKLDTVIAGVRANLGTATLTRLVAATKFWVRATILGNVVKCDYFTAAPGPLTTPTSTISRTLAGANITTFGAAVAGGYGRVFVPQDAAASLDDYIAIAHSSGSVTLPAVVQFGTPIPGDAPALADITVTHSGGTSAPIWALLGWTRRPGAGLAPAPFGILEAEAAGNLSGWIVTADAAGRGGSVLKDTAASSADVFSASWEVDPSLLVPDEFEDEVSIEVWARVLLSSTSVSPTFVLSARPEDGLSFGAARYTDEWGQTGRILTKPSSGSGLYRYTRLGTLRLRVDPRRPRKWLVWLGASVGIGSSGVFGLDYLKLVRSRQRACSPSGVVDDTGYPDFMSSTAQTSKTIRTDLSAMVASPPKWGHPDHGLAGQLIELPIGSVDVACKLSSLVPDDPTVNANTEQLAHTGTVEMNVTPCWHLLRS